MFTFWLTRLLVRFLEVRQQFGSVQGVHVDLHPDWRVVVFTVGIAVFSGLLFGLAPALRTTRIGIGAGLKETTHNLRGRAGAGGRAGGRWRPREG
ncbi:hypothetical protein B4Q13_25340 [Lacticaseibacillus rhamnosus]